MHYLCPFYILLLCLDKTETFITEVCACRYVGLECWPYRECRKESLSGFFLDRLEKLQYFDMGIWRQTWISSIFCQYQQKFTLPPIPHTLLKYIACDILRYHFFHLHLRRQSHLFGIELNRNLLFWLLVASFLWWVKYKHLIKCCDNW